MATPLLPPGPKTILPGGSFLAMRRDPTAFLWDAARKYGDIVHFRWSNQDVYLLNHPDFVRDVLVTHQRNFTKGPGSVRLKRTLGEGLLTSEGDTHLRQRRLMQPAFHRARIAAYGSAMTDSSLRTSASWQAGETRDIAKEMMSLTLGIVGKTLFDADVEGEAGEIGEALDTLFAMFQTELLPFSELLTALPLPPMRRLRAARARLDATIYRLIDEHRATGDRGDLLSMLLLAQDDEDGAGMSDQQVRDEAITLFVAGHETTANALTWTWYLLSQHPAAEARLHDELARVLAGRTPTMAELPNLPYTRQVLSESLRLYPPAWTMGRRVREDYEVGGYLVPAGATVLMSQWVMHHDPRYYPEPFRFDPDRWTPEEQAARPKFSFFPFGAGSRLCIGEQFAWMEGILVLATLAQRWRLRLVPGHPIALRPAVTLRPRHGMRMVVERRDEPPATTESMIGAARALAAMP